MTLWWLSRSWGSEAAVEPIGDDDGGGGVRRGAAMIEEEWEWWRRRWRRSIAGREGEN